MRARIATTLIGAPLLLGALVAGGRWWTAFVGVVTALALIEWRLLVRGYLGAAVPWEALLGAGLYPAVVAYGSSEALTTPTSFGWPAVVLAATVYTLFRETFGSGRRPLASAAALLLGTVYVAGLMFHLVLLRGLGGDGLPLSLLAVVGTWVTDTGAFFIGRAVGGRKLIPALSPGKTVAGAVGGWVSGFVALALAGVFWAAWPLDRALLLAAVIPVAAQAGDLLESALKREAKVKDTGRLLPGHGGVLDRFDSLLLVVPVVYYMARLF